MKRRFAWLAPWVAAFALLALSGTASIFPDRSIEEMCELSDEILHGTVVSKSSAYEPSGQIWTTYEISVADSMKHRASNPPSKLTIKQIGGTVDDMTMVAVGFPHFEVGAEVILFTRDFGAGFQTVTNGGQGAWPVVSEPTKDAKGADTTAKSVPGLNRMKGAGGASDLASVKQTIRNTLKTIEERKSKEGAR